MQVTRFNHRVSRLRVAYKAMIKNQAQTMYHWAHFHRGLQLELVRIHLFHGMLLLLIFF